MPLNPCNTPTSLTRPNKLWKLITPKAIWHSPTKADVPIGNWISIWHQYWLSQPAGNEALCRSLRSSAHAFSDLVCLWPWQIQSNCISRYVTLSLCSNARYASGKLSKSTTWGSSKRAVNRVLEGRLCLRCYRHRWRRSLTIRRPVS